MAKVVAPNLFALSFFVLVLYISPWLLFCIASLIVVTLKNVKRNILLLIRATNIALARVRRSITA